MNKKINLQKFKQVLVSQKLLKAAFYICMELVILYLISKLFKDLSSILKGFNELTSAIYEK